MQLSTLTCLFVCFIIKSFLTYSFFHLHLFYQPYLGLFLAQCVQSSQRQPMSAVAITACEVQVSAADFQTVPTGLLCRQVTLASSPNSPVMASCFMIMATLPVLRTQITIWDNVRDNKCLALIAQLARTFVMNPKVGGSSPSEVETLSVSKTLTHSQEYPFVFWK